MVYIGLSARVIRGRGQHRVGLGSGGIDDMERSIRAHGNFAEYVPLTMLLIARMKCAADGPSVVTF